MKEYTGPELSQESEKQIDKTWEELPEKVLLASLLAEQQRTNQLLAKLTDTDSEGVDGEATPMFECTLCGDTVREGKRQRHADGQHNTPPGGWEDVFERVE